jgi:hypothetical protein
VNKCLFCLDYLGQYVPNIQDFGQWWVSKAVIMGGNSCYNFRSDAESGVPILVIFLKALFQKPCPTKLATKIIQYGRYQASFSKTGTSPFPWVGKK